MTAPRAAAAPPNDNPLRLLGHVGTVLVGALLLVAAAASVLSSQPRVLTVALVVFGAASLVLAWTSWRGSRIGWAFAVSLDGVLALIELFGSAKIGTLVGVPLAAAALPCVLAAISCLSLAMLHADYERAT